MGNYENLKQSITEVIRTNGNQEITGAVLQSTLLTIISTVGANATFAGIATPATNPGTPDGPVFWLASESGTYSNFGSIELQDGLSVLTWNGSWSSQQILSTNRFGYNVTVFGLVTGVHTLATAVKNVPLTQRFGGQKITFKTDSGWVTYQNTSLDTSDYENVTNWVLDSGVSELGDVTITNNPDYEDLTQNEGGQLKFADKTYNAATYTGLGRKYLRKNIAGGVNILTQDMLVEANTIYHIQYDYTLSENITIPENCVLEFDGGSISGEHTITGQNTGIEAGLVKIFSTDVTLAGTFVIKSVNAHLFGAKADGVADDTLAIQKAELLSHCVLEKRPPINGIKQYANKFELINGVYKVSSTIFIGSNISFNGNGSMLKPVPNGNFDNDYIIKVKEQTQVGDFYKIVWENIAIFNEDTNTSLNGIYFGGQGYIKRISTINIDRAIYVAEYYKDFVEIDGVYCQDGSPDVYKIYGGYMGDARVFKNISTGGTAIKALEVGRAHMTCTVENLIHGALLIERSATLVKSCMFNNDANSIVTIKGACVDFVNCFFGFFGKEKVFINGDVYGWMKPNVNFENCIFGYTPEFYVPKEEFVDNPISISDSGNGVKVNFVNTYFGEKYEHAFYSTFAPHINNYDSLNIYFEDGIKNTSSIASFSKEVEGLYISGVNCSVSGKAPNLLGTAGTWNYGIRLIVDAKRQLIAGTKAERSLEVTKDSGVIITSISTSNNKNAVLYIEKEINGIYQYVLMPLRNNPPVLLDNGITIGGRKWNDGTIDLSYAIDAFRVDFMSVKANSDTFNVKVYAPLLNLAQINNRIINHNSDNWLKGDTLICAEGEFIKNGNGDWYNNAGVKLGTKVNGTKSERPVGSAIHVGFQYLQVDTINGTFPIWASTISGDTVTWVDATGIVAGTPTSGIFSNKPTVSANNIPIGFKYFCTDKQTTEGTTDGIEIIHKGNDVWVDALGRVVS